MQFLKQINRVVKIKTWIKLRLGEKFSFENVNQQNVHAYIPPTDFFPRIVTKAETTSASNISIKSPISKSDWTNLKGNSRNETRFWQKQKNILHAKT